MSTHREPETQLGDATIHRCSGGGFFGIGDVDLIVHQADSTHMRVGVREGTNTATARLKIRDLPDLIQTLISRSGRTDLTLHQDEPPTTDDGAHVKITIDADADADADPSRTVQALTKAAGEGIV